MAKPNDANENQTDTSWGTWEELLLSCAVHRYGIKSWDSVAIEIRKRSSNLNNDLFTAQTCKQKFHDLKRRFMDQNDDVSEHHHNGDGDGDGDDDDRTRRTIPWLDELRKLRVAELKREVERYDLSIVSLQSKVKRLKEEREQSLRENEEEREKSDREKSTEKAKEEENRDGDGDKKSSPEYSAGKPAGGEESGRDNQSVNESNSTDRKDENTETLPEVGEEKPEPLKPDAGEQDPADCTKPAGEDSFNGSSDTIAKGSAASPVDNSEKVDPVRESSDSPELWESVAESKGGGGEEGTKENSDVQSSVKSQPENEDQSRGIKRAPIESQPLVDFLEMIRSHRLGSIFERRLESQETTNYTSLIRQHIDLETIRTRLEEGWYSGCDRKFFRDVLLLFNNAMVFFEQKSAESMAALELRQLVTNEMTRRTPKSEPSPVEQIIPPPPPQPTTKPADPEPSDSLLVKQKISAPMIACRKRSSIVAKASATTSGTERKREQTATLVEEKPVLNWKQHEKPSVDAEEHGVTKKRTRERFTPIARNSTKNGKTRSNSNANKNSDTNSNENSEPKLNKKKNNNATTNSSDAKRRSAASFLSRMKRGSMSNNGSLLETLKGSSVVGSENSKGGGAEHKKNGSRSDGRKDQVSRKGSSGKQGKEQRSPAKRSVGRPPKRAAAPPPSRPPVLGKRSREAAETEAVASRQAKKRSRK
ncbi:hypothetical protein L1049_021609 [Liquidambar formosana]|uniref:Bromo domain-containing protein n=1 Tax=Liquidambar formosana TaxID=63359 RepID=A0AAP0R444_LIQFO